MTRPLPPSGPPAGVNPLGCGCMSVVIGLIVFVFVCLALKGLFS